MKWEVPGGHYSLCALKTPTPQSSVLDQQVEIDHSGFNRKPDVPEPEEQDRTDRGSGGSVVVQYEALGDA